MSDVPDPRPLPIDPDALPLQALALDPAAFQSPLPVQNHHLVYHDASIGLAVGVWDTTTMQEAFGPYPGDEFITVVDGRFAILDAADTAVAGEAGQSATFRNGIPVSWKQDGYLRKIYLTLLDPRAAPPGPLTAEGGVRVLDAGRQSAATPDPDGATREVVFRNDAGTMTVWHAVFPDAATEPDPVAVHRLVRVLRGAVVLTDAAGRRDRHGPGAHVFLPCGTRCGWEVTAGTEAFLVDVAAG